MLRMKKKCSVASLFNNSVTKSAHLLLTAILLVTAVLFNGNAYAQSEEKEISGIVKEAETGEPIPGASIAIQGASGGTITDADGKFQLTVKETDVLNVSSIGFTTKKIEVVGQSRFDIHLEVNVELFDEVVVIGYGVQKKKLITGATAQVKGGDLEKRTTTGALQALQGQAAGVQISSTSGQPGEDLKVIIRGAGTINNAGPLYVVDGIQTGDISYLNNADIESVDVLKDAASAAIYGSQAANGVVLITTKSGSKGKAQLSFDAYYGWQNAPRKMDLLNSQEYAVIMNESAINSDAAPYFTADEIAAMGEGTDWVDQMLYDNAVTQNYNLGLNGGNEVSTYSMSLSYTGQEGIVGGPSVSNFDRYNFRINTEHELYDGFLTFGQHLTFGYVEKNGISVGDQYNNTLRGAFNTSPFLPMYDDAGNFLNNSENAGVMYQGEEWEPWAVGENNPYASMIYNNQSRNNNQKMLGDVYMEIEPIKNLKFKTRLGVDYYASEGRSFKPVYALSIYSFRINDEAFQKMERGLALTWDNFATYNANFGDHALTAMLGTTMYRNRGNWLNVKNTNLITSDLDHAYINNTTNTNLTTLSYGGAPNDESMLLSYFGRVGYNYMEKYMLNATFRRDGSSRFHPDHRWGNFPSVSAGWVMTNESFMDDAGWLDFFKLRASWGQVGNQNISAWQYLAPVNTQNAYYYYGSEDFNASGNVVGAFQDGLANPELIWETSEQSDIGFDAQILNNRMNVNFDWYNKTTRDWLVEVPTLAHSGVSTMQINGGDVTNKGIELAVSWNDKIGEFNYYVSANIAKNSNEVTKVPDTEDGIIHGKTNMLYNNSQEFYRRAESGYPIGYFWGYETDGLFQNEADVAAHTSSDGTQIQPNAKPGDVRYNDLNDDGIIDLDDRTMVGDPNPDYTFGLSAGFNIKGFDFSISGNGVAGNQIVQSYRNHTAALSNYTTEVLGRWHGEGTSNRIPRVTDNNINYQFSDLYIKDGDFFRINNISLGYDFANLVDAYYIGQLRVYASVVNAFTFTKYNGMDPEIGYGVEDGSSGVDLGFYPQPRTILIGVNVKF